ncbi:MAG: UPF0175 family protein [Candidatus Micrarchaeota archaeon]
MPKPKSRKMEAIDGYRARRISLEKSARLAGVSVSEMMDLLSEYGIPSNVTVEDFEASLRSVEKIRPLK